MGDLSSPTPALPGARSLSQWTAREFRALSSSQLPQRPAQGPEQGRCPAGICSLDRRHEHEGGHTSPWPRAPAIEGQGGMQL